MFHKLWPTLSLIYPVCDYRVSCRKDEKLWVTSTNTLKKKKRTKVLGTLLKYNSLLTTNTRTWMEITQKPEKSQMILMPRPVQKKQTHLFLKHTRIVHPRKIQKPKANLRMRRRVYMGVARILHTTLLWQTIYWLHFPKVEGKKTHRHL